jgi:FAD synthase
MKVFFGFEEYHSRHNREEFGKITELLKNGKMERVNLLLGSPYRITGTIGHCIKTHHALSNKVLSYLNIDRDDLATPGPGVYEVMILHKGTEYKGKVRIVEQVASLHVEFLIYNFTQSIFEQELQVVFASEKRSVNDEEFRELESYLPNS